MRRLTTALLLTALPMTTLSMATTQAAEQPNRKLMIKTSAWIKTPNLRVLHKGSETSPSTEYAEVEAYKAAFKPADKMQNQDARGAIGLVVIFDKQTHRHFVIDGNHDFYIVDGTHLTGYTIIFGDTCIWSDDYISEPTSTETAEILKNIETSITAKAVENKCGERMAKNRIHLWPVLPIFFFSQTGEGGANSIDPDIFSIESHGDSIRLRLKNPITQKTAHLEINPKNKTAKRLPLIL